MGKREFSQEREELMGKSPTFSFTMNRCDSQCLRFYFMSHSSGKINVNAFLKSCLLCSPIRTEVSDIYSSQALLMIILILGLEEIYTN